MRAGGQSHRTSTMRDGPITILPMAATQKVSVSSRLSEAVRTYREEAARREAQEELLASFEPSERATPEEMEEIRAEWRD